MFIFFCPLQKFSSSLNKRLFPELLGPTMTVTIAGEKINGAESLSEPNLNFISSIIFTFLNKSVGTLRFARSTLHLNTLQFCRRLPLRFAHRNDSIVIIIELPNTHPWQDQYVLNDFVFSVYLIVFQSHVLKASVQ